MGRPTRTGGQQVLPAFWQAIPVEGVIQFLQSLQRNMLFVVSAKLKSL